MTISLSDTGKRFNREWIFRHLDYCFEYGTSYAITGPNGSGKSTLLQAIAGSLTISEGVVSVRQGDAVIEPELFYRQLAIAAPYLELIEEMTAKEFLNFHASFKPLLPKQQVYDILSTVGLEKAADKQIRYFSSGMKQRLKLGQAIFSDTPLLLLDEPCTNLDASGITLYQELINQYCLNRLVIVSSNDPQEYGFCDEQINIMKYRQ